MKKIIILCLLVLGYLQTSYADLPDSTESDTLYPYSLGIQSCEIQQVNGQLSFNMYISFNDTFEFKELFDVDMEGDVFVPVIPSTTGGGSSQNNLTFSLTNK